MRRRGRQPREGFAESAGEAQPDTTPMPDAGREQDDRRRLLGAAVASLPAGQRQAVEHLALAERSLEEASALTGRSKVALKVNLHRALKVLRTRLSGDRDRDDV